MEIGTYVWIMSFGMLKLALNMEWFLFLFFLICYKTHFGAPLRIRKGCVISFQSNPSFVFDQGVNKKVNKHFDIQSCVQMTWSTHKYFQNKVGYFFKFFGLLRMSELYPNNGIYSIKPIVIANNFSFPIGLFLHTVMSVL